MHQPGHLGQQPGVTAPQVFALQPWATRMSGRHSSARARSAHTVAAWAQPGTTRTSRPGRAGLPPWRAAWCGACGAAPAPRPCPAACRQAQGLPPPGWRREPAGDEMHHPHGSPGSTLGKRKLNAPREPLRPPSGGTRCRSKGTCLGWLFHSFMSALGLGQNTPLGRSGPWPELQQLFGT